MYDFPASWKRSFKYVIQHMYQNKCTVHSFSSNLNDLFTKIHAIKLPYLERLLEKKYAYFPQGMQICFEILHYLCYRRSNYRSVVYLNINTVFLHFTYFYNSLNFCDSEFYK